MADFTRRSHIVRIGTSTDQYIDMEVLDAVAFTTTDGTNTVLNLPGADAAPYIVDDTGDGNAKATYNATRRSHMKRITSPTDATQFLDIEVLDAIAFRDENGKEWILDLPGDSSVFNSTDGTGDFHSTRRVHTEKIYSDPTDKTSDFMAVERCDTMSFRSVQGEELIIVMPSSDDLSGPGRASTYTTPENYDPNGTDVVPPANTDPSVYAFFPSKSKGALTGVKDAKTQPAPIACGPLWWPRGTSKKGGPWYMWYPLQQPVQFTLYMVYSELLVIHTPGYPDQLVRDTAGNLVYKTQSSESWGLYPNVTSYNYSDRGGGLGAPIPPFGFMSLDDAMRNGGLGDWWPLDFSDTRIDPNLDNLGPKNGLSLTPCIPGVRGGPDIWQLTGIPAPALIPPPNPSDPNSKWTAGPVSSALAKRVAIAFGNCWNGTSSAWNSEMWGCTGPLGKKTITWREAQVTVYEGKEYNYPSTSFAVPLYDMMALAAGNWTFSDMSSVFGGRYIGGLPGDFWNGYTAGNSEFDVSPGAYIWDETPPYASMIGVGQLDPNVWDTTFPAKPTLRRHPTTP